VKPGDIIEVQDAHSNFIESMEDGLQNSGVTTDDGFECVFIVPGFMTNTYSEWMPRLKDKILNNVNSTLVCIVEWGEMKEYACAAANTRLVGSWLGGYFLQLQCYYKNRVFIRCIGHGLGAHLVAFSGVTVDRIDALDPAGLLFENGYLNLFYVKIKKKHKNRNLNIDFKFRWRHEIKFHSCALCSSDSYRW